MPDAPAPIRPPATVRVEPLGRSFPAAPDQTLLMAAFAGGVVLPSACRNGTCRACMCQAHGGPVRYRIAWPGLSAEEKADGWVLPCVALAEGPLTLHVPGARMATSPPL